MPQPRAISRFILAAAAAAALSGCATTYTGPVEVTRFVAEDRSQLGQGEIAIAFPDEISNDRARTALGDAVASELEALGYTIVPGPGPDTQIAAIRSSRNPIAGSTGGRSPVSVGVGGRTGSYGSGVGLGVGINLGGGDRGPNIVTELSVRISDASGEALWEGRAELPTSIKSPYSEVELSAQTLAAALFSDFPGGNGETVIVTVDELKGTQ